MVRIDPAHTPASRRGRGSAGIVTVETSRAAVAAGATDVVVFADPGNPTSNALYQRIRYVRVTDFAGYTFSHRVVEVAVGGQASGSTSGCVNRTGLPSERAYAISARVLSPM
ncbi:hypothetical protein GCM10010329_62760 [Streptomyces spiroverticillatus]|nr:hypothetical protein GCM10010329_62760 [Streptomyces spiroverticillatus]